MVSYRQLREPNNNDLQHGGFIMMSYEAMTAMTNEEISARISELSHSLYFATGSEWDELYKEYVNLTDIIDERYREKNQAEFDAFYEKYIKGKSWEEIDPKAWQCYSDWHKDMYGFRPRHI